MGGAVAFATRFSDGEIVCMDAWTNPLPYLIKTKKVLLDRDEAAVRAHFQECREVKELDGRPMHVDVPLAPLGYGLIVLDFQSNVLLSMQNYTGFDNFSELEGCGLSDADKFADFLALCDAGQIQMIRRDYKVEDDHCTDLISRVAIMVKDAAEGRELAKVISAAVSRGFRGEKPRRSTYFSFNIVGNQFEQTRFSEFSSVGARAFRTTLKKLNFQLSRPAQLLWRDWIKEMAAREIDDA